MSTDTDATEAPRRAFDSVKRGVRYSLDKDRVYMILIATTSGLELDVGKYWVPCK
jgi:hypothetical protein